MKYPRDFKRIPEEYHTARFLASAPLLSRATMSPIRSGSPMTWRIPLRSATPWSARKHFTVLRASVRSEFLLRHERNFNFRLALPPRLRQTDHATWNPRKSAKRIKIRRYLEWEFSGKLFLTHAEIVSFPLRGTIWRDVEPILDGAKELRTMTLSYNRKQTWDLGLALSVKNFL